MERNRILVVDDDPLIRGSLYELLRSRHLDVEMASDGAEAMDHLKRSSFELVLADWKMPQVDGISLLGHIKSEYPDVAVVLITGFATISSAVKAIHAGAFDYLTKPIQPDELEATIKRALSRDIQKTDKVSDPFEDVIGDSAAMKKLLTTVRRVADSPATVLLEGDSGTGKRVIAQAIHRADPKRCNNPFIDISCGALPEALLESELFGHVRGAFTGAIRDKQGRFEVANGGTILLDEVDTLSPAMQVKLLRVLQERVFERVGDNKTICVDVRIIAASNRNLYNLVQEGSFRSDFYYRLNVISIQLPPLKDRIEDVEALANYFLENSSREMGKSVTGISKQALDLMARYSWPGNVRELENVIARAVVLTQNVQISPEDLSDELQDDTITTTQNYKEPELVVQTKDSSKDESAVDLKQALKSPERDLILNVLAEVRWNRSKAAKKLGLHRSTLYHKMRQLGINVSS